VFDNSSGTLGGTIANGNGGVGVLTLPSVSLTGSGNSFTVNTGPGATAIGLAVGTLTTDGNVVTINGSKANWGSAGTINDLASIGSTVGTFTFTPGSFGGIAR